MTFEDLQNIDPEEWTGDDVRALRQQLSPYPFRRISQTQLARLLGTRQDTVSNWERGAHTPGPLAGRLLTIVRELHGEGCQDE